MSGGGERCRWQIGGGQSICGRVGFGVDVAGHGDVLELGPEEEFRECGVLTYPVGASAECGMRGRRTHSCRPLTPVPLPIGWGEGERGLRIGICVRNEMQEVGGLEMEEPIAETAVLPFGEVLFVDWTVVEVGGEDGLDFRESVEPGEDRFGRDAVVEFEVELFANGMREASAFAETSCRVHMFMILVFRKKCKEGG